MYTIKELQEYDTSVAIHCPTEKEVIRIACLISETLGNDEGSHFGRIGYMNYGSNTAMSVNNGCYCDIAYYSSHGFAIVESSEVTDNIVETYQIY